MDSYHANITSLPCYLHKYSRGVQLLKVKKTKIIKIIKILEKLIISE